MTDLYENVMFYGSLLVFKVMIMSVLTSRMRHKSGNLRTPEDGQFRLGTTDVRYCILFLTYRLFRLIGKVLEKLSNRKGLDFFYENERTI